MKKAVVTIVCGLLLGGCEFGAAPVVYYPAHHHEPPVVVVEESTDVPQVIEEQVTVVETYTYTSCDPYFETLEAPFYHQPVTCTDYGYEVGYCCTWEYLNGDYAGCSHESCFWEDICEWEFVIEECVYDDYY